MSGSRGMRRTTNKPEPSLAEEAIAEREREERDRAMGGVMPDIVVKGSGIFAPWDFGHGSTLKAMERFTGF